MTFQQPIFFALVYVIAVYICPEIQCANEVGGSSQNEPVLNDYELVELGNQLVELKEYAKALEFYDEAIRRDPSQLWYYRKRATCYVILKNYVMAFLDFNKVVSIAAQSRQDAKFILDDLELGTLGKGLFEIWRYQDAIWCTSQAIQINPSNPGYYRVRGAAYLKTKNWDAAISDLKYVIQGDSKITKDDRLRLAEALLNAGRIDEAVLETLPLDDGELVKLGDSLRYSKKSLEAAVRCYTGSIEKNSKNAQHYIRRGTSYLELEKIDLAIPDFEQAVRFDPKSINNWYFLTSTLFSLKRVDDGMKAISGLSNDQIEKLASHFFSSLKYEGAILIFTEAIRRKPTNASNYRKRGNCHLRLRKLDLAISDFREGMKFDPKNEYERKQLSEILFNAARYEEAIDETIALDDTQLALLGMKFLYHNKVKEALRCFDEAITKNSQNAVYYKNRGLCYWKLKNLQEAILDFENAIQKSASPTVDLQMDLCEVLTDKGEYGEAKKILAKVDERFEQESLSTSSYAAKIKNVRDKLTKMENGQGGKAA